METGWISVKEKLPKVVKALGYGSVTVLLHHVKYKGTKDAYETVSLGYLRQDGKWIAIDNSRYGRGEYPQIVDPDLWMPIPAIPQEYWI